MKHYEVFINGVLHGQYEAANKEYARMKCAHEYGFSLSSFDKFNKENDNKVRVKIK